MLKGENGLGHAFGHLEASKSGKRRSEARLSALDRLFSYRWTSGCHCALFPVIPEHASTHGGTLSHASWHSYLPPDTSTPPPAAANPLHRVRASHRAPRTDAGKTASAAVRVIGAGLAGTPGGGWRHRHGSGSGARPPLKPKLQAEPSWDVLLMSTSS